MEDIQGIKGSEEEEDKKKPGQKKKEGITAPSSLLSLIARSNKTNIRG